MKRITVAFCDGSDSLTANASAFFSEDSDIQIVPFSALTGQIDSVDAAVIDTEYYSFRETATSMAARGAKIVITSHRMQEEASFSVTYDAICYKPYSFLELKSKIMKLVSAAPTSKATVRVNRALDERLSNIFIRAGIPPHIKGYQFLRESVKFAVAHPEMINSITKKLYPAVAETYNTTSSKVERAIRHAIEVAWNRGKIENINAVFGIKIYGKGDKPTNGELIALIADKLIIESY